MRWFARAVTGLIVLAFLGGPPLLAGFWLSHRPWPPLTADGVSDWLQGPRTPTDVVGGSVIIVAASLWLLLLGYLTRRGLHSLSRRWRQLRSLPLPTPAQVTVGSMAGVAALTMPAAAVEHAPGIPSATADPPPADPARKGPSTLTPALRGEQGIDLPGGGWMPYRTAAVIAALATTIWMHRRRTYRPDVRRLGTHDSDADLQPLPATVQAVTAAVEQSTSPRQPEPVLPEHLPPGALHLHGPGALAAARGLLVTAALTTPPVTGLAIQSAHRNDILPSLDNSTLAAVGITVLPATEPERPQADIGAANRRGNAPWSSGMTESRSPTETVTVLAIGDPPTAHIRWHVAADGTVTGTGITSPRRLCTLDVQAASDLLALARQRHPATPREPALIQNNTSARRAEYGRPVPARLALLGGCVLMVSGQAVRLRRSAGMQILAYLAVHPTGATRSELIAAAWPDLPSGSISQRLHTTLSDLRRQLQPVLTEPVQRMGDRYYLNTEMIETDLDEWRAALTTATQAIGSVARVGACRKLVQLYQGELAASRPWPWIQSAREKLRREALDACLFLAEQANPADALSWLHQGIAIDPYNTSLQQQAVELQGNPTRRLLDL
ncbi:hypothetical protein AB0M02_10720 [Actinoplanes sp. NPDC051861]|uniref:AfsR/SARP family transcriptional regulator n=1 Tax=Actinoplanes sp. NPDC051861 TaxID=3155170 RepID=UPI0034217C6B